MGEVNKVSISTVEEVLFDESKDSGVVINNVRKEIFCRSKDVGGSSCSGQIDFAVYPLEFDEDAEDTHEKENTCNLPQVCSSQSSPKVLKGAFDMVKNKRGLLFAVLSAAFYAVKNLCMEVVIKNELDPFQMLVMLMPASTVGTVIWVASNHIKLPRDVLHYLWLLFSGVLFTCFVIFFALSVQNLDVGDAVTVAFTYLIQVALWSWVVLVEPLKLLDLGFAILAFVGIIFVARPSFIFGTSNSNNATLLGVCFALVSSVSVALLLVVLRKHQQLKINTFVSIFVNSVVAIITSAVCCTALKGWSFPKSQEWIFAELAGIAYFIAQVLACCALHYESANAVAIATTAEIVFTFLLQYTCLNVIPEWMSYIGALLIMGSCVGMGLLTHRRQKRQELVMEPEPSF